MIIQTPTSQIDKSLDFYDRINFTLISDEAPNLVSDGEVVIQINPDRLARAGIILYNSDWGKIIKKLEQVTKVISLDKEYLLADPSGSWIYLKSGEAPPLDISSCNASIIGKFAGLSLETMDLAKSIEIFQLLGFQITMGAVEQGWICLANEENAVVSLMKPLICPHLFFNPSLSFFNGGNNLPVIAKIRELNIPITEEITHFSKDGVVDNVIIRDPGGLGFFVFND